MNAKELIGIAKTNLLKIRKDTPLTDKSYDEDESGDFKYFFEKQFEEYLDKYDPPEEVYYDIINIYSSTRRIELVFVIVEAYVKGSDKLKELTFLMTDQEFNKADPEVGLMHNWTSYEFELIKTKELKEEN